MNEYNKIIDNLYLGNYIAAYNMDLLNILKVKAIVNCTNEVGNLNSNKFIYLKLFLNDTPDENILNHFDSTADFIHNFIKSNQGILVHCAAGVSRSATITIAYLMKYHKLKLKDAYHHVKKCRPIINPNEGFIRHLINYEYKLYKDTTITSIPELMDKVPEYFPMYY